jgi:hypothetical protein
MDSRNINEIHSKYDAIVCGFCLPYLSQADNHKFILDSNQILNKNGLIYLSFVEGDPTKSGFQEGSTGDRSYFYFHNLSEIKTKLIENNFDEFNVLKVDYKKSTGEKEIHTIITARKK